jgi:hypothetical protein
MPKVVSIQNYQDLASTRSTNAQLAADKRKKTRAVLRRLRAGQNLCKIGLAERVGWHPLTEIVFEFMDWGRVNCCIKGNERAA